MHIHRCLVFPGESATKMFTQQKGASNQNERNKYFHGIGRWLIKQGPNKSTKPNQIINNNNLCENVTAKPTVMKQQQYCDEPKC